MKEVVLLTLARSGNGETLKAVLSINDHGEQKIEYIYTNQFDLVEKECAVHYKPRWLNTKEDFLKEAYELMPHLKELFI